MEAEGKLESAKTILSPCPMLARACSSSGDKMEGMPFSTISSEIQFVVKMIYNGMKQKIKTELNGPVYFVLNNKIWRHVVIR